MFMIWDSRQEDWQLFDWVLNTGDALFIWPKTLYKHSVAQSHRRGKESGRWSWSPLWRHQWRSFLHYISRWWRQTLDTPLYFTVVNQSEARISTEQGINIYHNSETQIELNYMSIMNGNHQYSPHWLLTHWIIWRITKSATCIHILNPILDEAEKEKLKSGTSNRQDPG